MEGLYDKNNSNNNLRGGSSGSVRSASSRGGGGGSNTSTVVRNRKQKAYDYRRMTESLWSPPPLATTGSGTAPLSSGGSQATVMTVGKDGGHLWNRKTVQDLSREGRERGVGSRQTAASNEGGTMSSVGVQLGLCILHYIRKLRACQWSTLDYF